MTEKNRHVIPSVFVTNSQMRNSKNAVNSNANVTYYTNNFTFAYKQTPYSGDFISMENRRKYTYNDQK